MVEWRIAGIAESVEEAVEVLFEVLQRHFPGETAGNQGTPQ
jgi:hypothetical protein